VGKASRATKERESSQRALPLSSTLTLGLHLLATVRAAACVVESVTPGFVHGMQFGVQIGGLVLAGAREDERVAPGVLHDPQVRIEIGGLGPASAHHREGHAGTTVPFAQDKGKRTK